MLNSSSFFLSFSLPRIQEAPMKFFYCVRAATKENVALPNVDNLLRPSAEYINAKNAYLDSLRTRDTDHDQSSDADSIRSESGVSSATAAAAPAPAPESYQQTTRNVEKFPADDEKRKEISADGEKRKEISATSLITATTTTATTTSRPNTTATTASTKTSTATGVVTTSPPAPSAATATSNGRDTKRDVSQTQRNHTPSQKSAEANVDRTPTSRPAATSSEAAQRLSATPTQSSSPPNAPEQPAKTNGNGWFIQFLRFSSK